MQYTLNLDPEQVRSELCILGNVINYVTQWVRFDTVLPSSVLTNIVKLLREYEKLLKLFMAEKEKNERAKTDNVLKFVDEKLNQLQDAKWHASSNEFDRLNVMITQLWEIKEFILSGKK